MVAKSQAQAVAEALEHIELKTSEREMLLKKAAECVLKDRNNQYGPPTADFTRIA